MIGITIGVGRWRTAAELAAAAARKHTGLRVVVLGDADWLPFQSRYPSPHFLKLHLFDLVDGEDLFYFDADCIHLNDWNPAQFAGRNALVAAIDPLIGHIADESGVPADRYFNSGVMILNRRNHVPLMHRAQELAARGLRSSVAEQTHLNKARQLCGIGLECLPATFNHLQFYDDPDFDPARTVIAHWTSLRDEMIGAIEVAMRDGTVLTVDNSARLAGRFIQQIPDCPATEFSGRGVVICAGGAKYLPSAWVLIRVLRDLGCALPIEVWYRGDEERDDDWIELVSAYGVECVDAEAVRTEHPHSCLGGWELKPYAALHSRFQELLLLDADNVPVCDPAYLFDAPEYQRTGALFWPDGFRMSPTDPSWKAFGVEYRDEPDMESGQLLIDKARCWRPLTLCNWYNERSYFFYRVVYGDKDTFRFAWHRLGQPFAMPERARSGLGCTILQYDPAGELIFQHRCGDKWRLSGNRRIAGFQHEDRCNAFMRDLRQRWRVLRRATEKLPAADRQRIEALADARFEMIRPGHNRWPIQLGSNGFVSAGWSPATFLWWVEDGRLILAGDDRRPTCRLAERDDGVWEGHWLPQRRLLVRLVPRPGVEAHGRGNM